MKQHLLIISLFIANLALAQSIEKIEKKLSKAFFKINDYRFYHTENNSLENANSEFEQLLLKTTTNNSETIHAKFQSLVDSGLVIITSLDGNFRIYSWNTWTGGTMRIYQNVLQYKINGQVHSKTFAKANDEASGCDCIFYEMHQVTSNSHNFYIAFSSATFSSGMFYKNVKVFSIDNNKLDENARLIKTKTGIKNSLGYEIDLTSSINRNKEVPSFEIEYDEINKVISIPVILDNNQVTKRRIRYQFNGNFFEKI